MAIPEELSQIAEILADPPPRKTQAKTPNPVISEILHDPKEDQWVQHFERDKSARAIRSAKRIWRTQDGREIRYSDLNPLHLADILLFLRLHAQKKIERVSAKDGFDPGPNGFRAAKPLEWEALLAELRSRHPREKSAVLADLIDSPVVTPSRPLILSFFKDSILTR